MKKLLTLILALMIMLLTFTGCSEPEIGSPVGSNAQMLNGKKVLFVGNSYTYYGNCVTEKKVTVSSQQARSNDQGYFYQICKSNGAEVSVTNWTYGGHALADSLGVCGADKTCNGRDHLADLVDRNFDYVILQNGTRSSELTTTQFVEQFKSFMNIFSSVNPNVKFVFMVHSAVHLSDYYWKPAIKEIEKEGVAIADWGNVVADVINGEVKVPKADLKYNKNSFIISKSEDDGYHPNMLTGYLTALSAYCAITDETAIGQDYSFCLDENVNPAFFSDYFISKNYVYKGATTNFVEIFNSPDDMKGLQTLVNRYRANKPYLEF